MRTTLHPTLAVSRPTLDTVLKALASIVPARSVLPTTPLVEVVIADERLSLTVDSGQGLRLTRTLPAPDAVNVGPVFVRIAELAGLIAALPTPTVELSISPDAVRVRDEAERQFTLRTTSAPDFPPAPGIDPAWSVTVPRAVAERWFGSVTFATLSPEQAGDAHALTSVEVSVGNGNATACATTRVSLATAAVPVATDAVGTALFPSRAIPHALALAPTEEAELTLDASPTRLRVQSATGTLICSTPTDAFPAWRGLVLSADALPIAITVDRAALRGAIQRAGVLVKGEETAVVVLTLTGSRIRVGLHNHTRNEGEEVVVGTPRFLDAPDLVMHFVPSLLLTALSNVPDDVVTLSAKTPKHAVQLTPGSDGAAAWTTLVMPCPM